MQSRATNVDAYLDEAPVARRAALDRLRALCIRVHAGSEECIDYGMAVYQRDGVMQVAFASQKHYISLYGLGAETIERYRAALQGADLGKSCIRFRKPEAIDFASIETMMIEARDSGRSGC